MKMQPDLNPGLNIVSAYGDDYFDVSGQRYAHAILMREAGDVQRWRPYAFAELQIEDFEVIAGLNTEIVILGTGRQHRFPKPEWLAPLIRRRIGIEAMNTAAALRTYNILAGEGRKVATALLLDQ